MTSPSGDVKPTLIAPSGNRYTIATEAEAISRARTLNAGPAADALAEAVRDEKENRRPPRCEGCVTNMCFEAACTCECHDMELRTVRALAAYRKASEEPK